jgi:FkbM family methyltransferase
MRKKIINATGQTDHEIKYQEVAGLKWHLNGRVVFKRVRRFFTKEPKTLEWIDSFGTQDKFLDIGANIGIYSLYAAKKDLQVYAFEPQALNFAELYTNIYLNDLQHKITGYGIALTDVNSIEHLSLLSMVPGQSHNNYDISKHNQIKQGCAGYRLDHLVEQGVIPQPDHVKIDVDGIESKVIAGGIDTISKCKSILVEAENIDILKPIQDIGFKIDNTLTFDLGISQYSNQMETNYILRK